MANKIAQVFDSRKLLTSKTISVIIKNQFKIIVIEKIYIALLLLEIIKHLIVILIESLEQWHLKIILKIIWKLKLKIINMIWISVKIIILVMKHI